MSPCSLLLSLLLVGAAVADSCILPEASTETFAVTTAHKQWYQQYRYASSELDQLGCFIVAQDPGTAANKMVLSGYFSKQPSIPVTADVTIEGNRLHSTYYGQFGEMLTAERNLVYGDANIFIEHFCMENVGDMTFIFTTEQNPSAELVNKVKEVVNARSEIDWSKFQKVSC